MKAFKMIRSIYIVIFVLLFACDSQDLELERDTAPWIQTEALLYQLEREGIGLSAEIGYTFENKTGAQVFLTNCRGAFNLTLEREENGVWKPIWYPFLLACLSPPIVIEAGETFNTQLHLWGALPGNNTGPEFIEDVTSGFYRLVWTSAFVSYQEDRYPAGEELELMHRVSNRFYLEIE